MFKMVEIEINKYCNRKCKWCYNNNGCRSTKERLPIKVIKKVIDELHNMGFKGVISFSRNNEPMADITYLKWICAYIKAGNPEIKTVTNTNGDFINYMNLEDLQIDELSIMDYECKGDWWANRLHKLGCTNIIIEDKYITALFNHMKIIVVKDWIINVELEDKGGLLNNDNVKGMRFRNNLSEREKSCDEPFDFVAIDYNGNVMPCCQMRSDCKEHEEYILGNIYENKLYDIFNSKKAEDLRNRIINKDFPEPCKHCHKLKGRYTRTEPNINYSKEYIK